MYDAIVVGAGPAGALAARNLAEDGFDILMMEEHGSSGLPQHGAGLITDSTLSMSGVIPEVYTSINGFEIVYPDGRTSRIYSNKRKAVVVNLPDMEMKMADAAARAGVKVSYNDQYMSHTIRERVLVESDSGINRSRMIIGADGAFSKVALSMGDNRPEEYIRGIQVDVDHRMEEQHIIRLHLGKYVAPGLFLWEIPCGDFTRIGLCTAWSAGDPSKYLSDFLIKSNLQDKITKFYSGKLPLGLRPMMCTDRCALVGDAAGFTSTLTGRGLGMAFRGNRNLMKVLPSCLESDNLFQRDLDSYDRLCKSDFGKDISKLAALRKRYRNLSDTDLNKIRDFISRGEIRDLLNDLDLDNPSKFFNDIPFTSMLSGIPLFLRSLI